MTGVVKDELSRIPVIKPCCRKTEVSTLLRFAGGLTLTAGRIVIEAELDTAAVAAAARVDRRGVRPHVGAARAAAGRAAQGQQVRRAVLRGGDSLARQAGLLDSFGRPVRGFPGRCDRP